jgi:hypothetical protein
MIPHVFFIGKKKKKNKNKYRTKIFSFSLAFALKIESTPRRIMLSNSRLLDRKLVPVSHNLPHRIACLL